MQVVGASNSAKHFMLSGSGRFSIQNCSEENCCQGTHFSLSGVPQDTWPSEIFTMNPLVAVPLPKIGHLQLPLTFREMSKLSQESDGKLSTVCRLLCSLLNQTQSIMQSILGLMLRSVTLLQSQNIFSRALQQMVSVLQSPRCHNLIVAKNSTSFNTSLSFKVYFSIKKKWFVWLQYYSICCYSLSSHVYIIKI